MASPPRSAGLAPSSVAFLPAASRVPTTAVLSSFPSVLVAQTEVVPALSFGNHFSVVQHAIDPWHYRLGHVGSQCMHRLSSHELSITLRSNFHCSVCQIAKQKQLSFPPSIATTTRSFDLVSMHIWGPATSPSFSGHSYFLTVVDVHTRFTWGFPLKFKSNVRPMIHRFFAFVRTQFSSVIKVLRTGNVKEFLILDYYGLHGTIHQTTCVQTSQQNGIVERKHQHILDITHTPCYYKLIYHSLFGSTGLFKRFISLIVLCRLFFIIGLPMSYFTIRNPRIITFLCLVASLTPRLLPMVGVSCLHGLSLVCLLFNHRARKLSFYTPLSIPDFLFLEMFLFLRIFFHSISSLIWFLIRLLLYRLNMALLSTSLLLFCYPPFLGLFLLLPHLPLGSRLMFLLSMNTRPLCLLIGC
ncbi:Retrovirus-related Pol polyprotein from transposon RE2 [Linum grandiflorum]